MLLFRDLTILYFPEAVQQFLHAHILPCLFPDSPFNAMFQQFTNPIPTFCSSLRFTTTFYVNYMRPRLCVSLVCSEHIYIYIYSVCVCVCVRVYVGYVYIYIYVCVYWYIPHHFLHFRFEWFRWFNLLNPTDYFTYHQV